MCTERLGRVQPTGLLAPFVDESLSKTAEKLYTTTRKRPFLWATFARDEWVGGGVSSKAIPARALQSSALIRIERSLKE